MKRWYLYLAIGLVIGGLLGFYLARPNEQQNQEPQSVATTIEKPTQDKISNESLLILTNSLRKEVGEPPLKLYEPLNKSAQAKCEHMVKNDYYAHDSPEGIEPWYFFKQQDIDYQKAGENLTKNVDVDITAKIIIDGWKNSPKHYEGIIDDEMQYVGFGICREPLETNPQYNNLIVVQHFAGL